MFSPGRARVVGCFRDRAARPERRSTPPTDPDERKKRIRLPKPTASAPRLSITFRGTHDSGFSSNWASRSPPPLPRWQAGARPAVRTGTDGDALPAILVRCGGI
jgi:hypothetical protein